MIRKSIYALSFAFVFFLSGCESVSNLFTVKVDTDFVVDIPVDITTPTLKMSGPYPFSVSKTFNPIEEPDIADYVDRIKEINLSSMTATVISTTAPFKLETGTLVVSGSVDSVTWTFTAQSIEDGSSLTLANDDGQFDTVSEILSETGDVTITFSGTSDIFGIGFVLQAILNSVVTAGL